MATTAPHDTASFKLVLNGLEITQADTKGMETLVVEDHVDMIGMAEASFQPGSELDWTNIPFGAAMEVSVDKADSGGGTVKVFVGIVTEVRYRMMQGRRLLTVAAMDPLCKLAASRNTRVFEEKTDSDIVKSVLGEAGATTGTVDSTSGANKYTFQRNESDLVFLKRLAARNGYLLTAKEGKIDFKKTQFSGQVVEIEQGGCELLDVTLTNAHLAPSVQVIGWDYVKKEVVKSKAEKGKVDAIGGGKQGVGDSTALWAKSSYIADVMVSTQSAADAMAAAELNRVSRTYVRGRAVVSGTAELYAGVKIKFKDFAAKLNPEGVVVSSRHTVGPEGFRTEIHFVGNTGLV
jgi:phage protein D